MSNFIEQHENYNAYTHDFYLMNDVPMEFYQKLSGFLHSQFMKLEEDDVISSARVIQHKIAGLASKAPSDFVPLPSLIDEVVGFFRVLEKKGFHYIIDAFEIILIEISNSSEINEFLKDLRIGYIVEQDRFGVNWIEREGVESSVANVEEVLQVIPNEYKDTIANLQEIISVINNNPSEKALKNIVRDGLSATEGYLKSITGEKDFPKADKKLREYPNVDLMIITDGLKIWNYIHAKYLDVRHGNNEEISTISIDIAKYYIDRLMIYIKYINKIYGNK